MSKEMSESIPKYDPDVDFSDYASACASFVIAHLPSYFLNRDHNGREYHDLEMEIVNVLFDDWDNTTKPSNENMTKILNQLRIVFGFDSDYNSKVCSFYDGFPDPE